MSCRTTVYTCTIELGVHVNKFQILCFDVCFGWIQGLASFTKMTIGMLNIDDGSSLPRVFHHLMNDRSQLGDITTYSDNLSISISALVIERTRSLSSFRLVFLCLVILWYGTPKPCWAQALQPMASKMLLCSHLFCFPTTYGCWYSSVWGLLGWGYTCIVLCFLSLKHYCFIHENIVAHFWSTGAQLLLTWFAHSSRIVTILKWSQ